LALQHVLLAQGRTRLHPHLPAGDSGPGVVQPIEKDSIDKKLLALMNGEGHANARQVVRRRNRNIGDVNGGIGKTIVEILSQNRVTVIRQTRFVKALLLGSRNFGELFLRKGVAALDADPRYTGLRALFDDDFDGQLRWLTLILVHQFAGDFGLPEATGSIETLNIPHILFEQHFAVASVTEQASGGLVLHARANLVVGKKPIARNTNDSESVAVAGIDGVNHLQILAALRAVLAHANGGLEITKSLKMVLNVAPAFVEQIIVDRAFFVDWHQSVQHALAEPETLGSNLHHRTAVHFEDVVHRIALGLVGAAGHRDLG